MRLLKAVDNRFVIDDFADDEIPPYVILSHTWGPDMEEVSYKDLLKSRASGKVGSSKLFFMAQRAATDGISHFWIDTCCIDKSSSAEISEAVNSMFRWYQNAEKCYVYLTDVLSDGVEGPEEEHVPAAWLTEFRKSRWFTRGWTLQELLAPDIVEFYSVDGYKLGDKTTLENELQSITNIAVDALRGGLMADFSVDDRLSWAEKRRTKRLEDAAYSLLGIFDIHMPLIYGEGKQKAMNRLRKEINANQPPELTGVGLFHAIDNGDVSMVEYYLKNGVSPDYTVRESVLHFAVRRRHNVVLSKLLESNPILDPYAEGVTPLMRAAVDGSTRAALILIQAGCPLESMLRPDRESHSELFDFDGQVIDGSTALFLAAQNGRQRMVELLLKHGANIEAKTSKSWTPLLIAAIRGHVGCVHILLESGANIEATNNEGFTALVLSGSGGWIEVGRLLLAHGANIEAKKYGDMTAFLEAVWYEHINYTDWIIQQGANIDAHMTFQDGGTALHSAVYDDSTHLIETLVRRHANIHAKDNSGRTAEFLALETGKRGIYEMLRAAREAEEPPSGDVSPCRSAAE